MRPIVTFTVSAMGLIMLYIVLTSANTHTGAASKLVQSGFSQFSGIIAQLQGRGRGAV